MLLLLWRVWQAVEQRLLRPPRLQRQQQLVGTTWRVTLLLRRLPERWTLLLQQQCLLQKLLRQSL
jgi:predicted metal-dependent hydrolase